MSQELSLSLIHEFREIQRKLELFCFQDVSLKMEIDNVLELPDEIYAEIVGYLPQRDVLSICLVNKRLYQIGTRKLFKKLYINSPDNMVIEGLNLPIYQNLTFVNYKRFLKLVKNDSRITTTQSITFHKPKFSQNFLNILNEKLPNTKIYIIDEISKKDGLENSRNCQISLISDEILDNYVPANLAELEINNSYQQELFEVIGRLSTRFQNLTSLSFINFNFSLPKTNFQFRKMPMKKLSIYGKFDLQILDILFDLPEIQQLLLVNKSFTAVHINYDVFHKFTKLTQLFLGGNLPIFNIICNLPRNNLTDLRLQLHKGIPVACLDQLMEFHAKSLCSLSYTIDDKFINGLWSAGLINGKHDSNSKSIIDDLNEIPDKYPNFTFASIFNIHFIIDRCFGDFIEAELIEPAPGAKSRRSSESSQEEVWIK